MCGGHLSSHLNKPATHAQLDAPLSRSWSERYRWRLGLDRAWRSPARRQLVHSLEGHHAWVNALRLVPGGASHWRAGPKKMCGDDVLRLNSVLCLRAPMCQLRLQLICVCPFHPFVLHRRGRGLGRQRGRREHVVSRSFAHAKC